MMNNSLQGSLGRRILASINQVIQSLLRSGSANAAERSSTFFHRARLSCVVHLRQEGTIPLREKHTQTTLQRGILSIVMMVFLISSVNRRSSVKTFNMSFRSHTHSARITIRLLTERSQ